MSHSLTAHDGFDDGTHNLQRYRCVSDIVLTDTINVNAPPTRLLLDWEREMTQQLNLEPGEVESLPLARARMRWPDYSACVLAAGDWTRTLGLADVLSSSEVALMACRGARYHHDAELYGGVAFCNLFLSEDKGLDLHFPNIGLRIPLTRGTAVIFDTAQTHAVIKRNSHDYDEADFPPGSDCSLVFLTWEMPIANVGVAQSLQITFTPP